MAIGTTQQVRLQFRYGTQAKVAAVTTALEGEPYYATDTKAVYISDGAQQISVLSNGPYTTTAIDLTLDATHHFVTVTAASKTITLPAAASCVGREYVIKTTATSTVIDADAAELIDGSATLTIYQYEAAQIISDGTGWHIV